MDLTINNIDLLQPKKVPKHGKVSGIKNNGPVRVIIPNENTKLSLIVSEPSEVLARNVTPDGKVLGLTNYIGKTIYIINQKIEDFNKETKSVQLFDENEKVSDELLNKLFRICEKENLDPNDLLIKSIKDCALKEASNKEELNE